MNATCKHLLDYIKNNLDENGEFNLGNKQIAEALYISNRSVPNNLKMLKEEKLIDINYVRVNYRIITLK